MADQRMRTPLGQAMGLGSAKEGVRHWWAQRLSAVALVPLIVWFVISLIELVGANRTAMVGWLHHQLAATVMVLLLVATFYHSALGLQVVIEDYVGNEALRLGLLIAMRLGAIALCALGIVAVLQLSLG